MELSQIREQIDNLDDEFVSLFKKRMELSALVAEYKKNNSKAVFDKGRERAIVARLTKGMDEEMSNYIRVLYNTVFEVSRALQNYVLTPNTDLAERIKSAKLDTPELFPTFASVACQGVEGAYSQKACDRLFPRAEITYAETFRDVFRKVLDGTSRYGVLPIENSLHGSVSEVYDLMKEYKGKVHIVRAVRVSVNHTLLANPGTKLSDVTEVLSHSQALGQCSEFLDAHPEITVTVCKNTAVAAKLVSKSGRRDIAAISSVDCAELYGLCVLERDVQNSDNNHTRFICVSKELEIYPGASKIGIMFTVPHIAGGLFSILSRFTVLGVNLTKLESRPIKGRDFEFMFYAEMETCGLSPQLLSFLCELDSKPEEFVFLGNYAEI